MTETTAPSFEDGTCRIPVVEHQTNDGRPSRSEIEERDTSPPSLIPERNVDYGQRTEKPVVGGARRLLLFLLGSGDPRTCARAAFSIA